MPSKMTWTDGQDTQIRRLRTEGASWDLIALQLGVARWTVIERAKLLGVERRPSNAVAMMDEATRPPLSAGHIETWGAINRNTALDGQRFVIPGAIR